jgi:hypothetical protein
VKPVDPKVLLDYLVRHSAKREELRGGRPATSDLLPAQAEAVGLVVAAIRARDPRPLLLDGVTGGGKTAIYVEAIVESLERGRPALLLVPEIALALPLVDRLRADLDARVALLHSGLGEGERADEWREHGVVGEERAVEAMKQEVESLTRPSGFELSWRSLDSPRIEQSFSDLVVVKFHGNCHMQGIQLLFNELGPESDGGVLGSTKVADGQVLPFSDIECDQIRRSIAPLTIGNSPDEREALLGRGLVPSRRSAV